MRGRVRGRERERERDKVTPIGLHDVYVWYVGLRLFSRAATT